MGVPRAPPRRRRRSAELGEDLVRQVPHVLVDVGPVVRARLAGRCDFVPEEVFRGVATVFARVDARRRLDVDRRDRDAVLGLGVGRLGLRRLGAFAVVLTTRFAVAPAGAAGREARGEAVSRSICTDWPGFRRDVALIYAPVLTSLRFSLFCCAAAQESQKSPQSQSQKNHDAHLVRASCPRTSRSLQTRREK